MTTKAKLALELKRVEKRMVHARARFWRIMWLVGEGSIGHPAKEIVKICREGIGLSKPRNGGVSPGDTGGA